MRMRVDVRIVQPAALEENLCDLLGAQRAILCAQTDGADCHQQPVRLICCLDVHRKGRRREAHVLRDQVARVHGFADGRIGRDGRFGGRCAGGARGAWHGRRGGGKCAGEGGHCNLAHRSGRGRGGGRGRGRRGVRARCPGPDRPARGSASRHMYRRLDARVPACAVRVRAAIGPQCCAVRRDGSGHRQSFGQTGADGLRRRGRFSRRGACCGGC